MFTVWRLSVVLWRLRKVNKQEFRKVNIVKISQLVANVVYSSIGSIYCFQKWWAEVQQDLLGLVVVVIIIIVVIINIIDSETMCYVPKDLNPSSLGRLSYKINYDKRSKRIVISLYKLKYVFRSASQVPHFILVRQ